MSSFSKQKAVGTGTSRRLANYYSVAEVRRPLPRIGTRRGIAAGAWLPSACQRPPAAHYRTVPSRQLARDTADTEGEFTSGFGLIGSTVTYRERKA